MLANKNNGICTSQFQKTMKDKHQAMFNRPLPHQVAHEAMLDKNSSHRAMKKETEALFVSFFEESHKKITPTAQTVELNNEVALKA